MRTDLYFPSSWNIDSFQRETKTNSWHLACKYFPSLSQNRAMEPNHLLPVNGNIFVRSKTSKDENSDNCDIFENRYINGAVKLVVLTLNQLLCRYIGLYLNTLKDDALQAVSDEGLQKR